jgi:3'(2'), 5'-bisphosphate nucleotidase
MGAYVTVGFSPLAAALARLAQAAGAITLRHYAGAAEARTKPDHSPVTDADEEAEALIAAELAKIAPGVPIVAEEAMAKGKSPKIGERFFLVDPLDGTKEFLKRNGEFTVNIALIEGGRAVLGVVLAPAKGRMFLGDGVNGAFELQARGGEALDLSGARRIHVRQAPSEGLTALVSRSHRDAQTDEYLTHYRIAKLADAGSSLKFALLAAGEADLYPRHGPTMEWDTAAGQAVVEAAGGTVTMLDGAPFMYGKVAQGFRNPSFVARGASGAHERT